MRALHTHVDVRALVHVHTPRLTIAFSPRLSATHWPPKHFAAGGGRWEATHSHTQPYVPHMQYADPLSLFIPKPATEQHTCSKRMHCTCTHINMYTYCRLQLPSCRPSPTTGTHTRTHKHMAVCPQHTMRRPSPFSSPPLPPKNKNAHTPETTNVHAQANTCTAAHPC